jgi:hypothetical protein
MIMNNEFKQFREIVENRVGSVIAHGGMIASFKYWYNSSFFPCSRGMKIAEQPFMMKPGISSSLTDLRTRSKG